MVLSKPIPVPKPSKGARLRTKKAAQAQAARDLSALYRTVYQRDGFRCRVCGYRVYVGSLNELKRAHPHHIVYRSKGGADTLSNLITLCPLCHADVHEARVSITGTATKLTIRERR